MTHKACHQHVPESFSSIEGVTRHPSFPCPVPTPRFTPLPSPHPRSNTTSPLDTCASDSIRETMGSGVG
eukprot:349584-Chlamydomonas_euryale.AAC.4